MISYLVSLLSHGKRFVIVENADAEVLRSNSDDVAPVADNLPPEQRRLPSYVYVMRLFLHRYDHACAPYTCFGAYRRCKETLVEVCFRETLQEQASEDGALSEFQNSPTMQRRISPSHRRSPGNPVSSPTT